MPPRQAALDRSALLAAGRAAFPGFRLRILARVPSTQDVVRVAARHGAAEGYCCVAGEQTAGRGRSGRRWLAPSGSALLTSVLLRPAPAATSGVTIAAGLATVDAIAGATAITARLRWPNDVLVDGAKLAGILAERVDGGAAGPAVILGIGVNLTVDDLPDGIRATSLHHLVGRPPTWEHLLCHLLSALGDRLRTLESGGIPALRHSWHRSAIGLGEPVRRNGPSGPVAGTAVDIDDDGALLVRVAGGDVVRVIAGGTNPAGEPG